MDDADFAWRAAWCGRDSGAQVMAVLDVYHMAAGYDGEAVFRGLNLRLDAGSGRCLSGRNGSGKSTCLRAVVRLAEIVDGRLTVLGRAVGMVRRHDFARLGVAYVPQDRGELPSLTVEENLDLAAQVLPAGERAEAVQAVFKCLPLLKRLRRALVDGLSGGERTLVALGRALCLGPRLRLLLLDEPSAGLSPSNRALLVDALQRVRDQGVALLMSEQNLEFARALGMEELPMPPPSRAGPSGWSESIRESQ